MVAKKTDKKAETVKLKRKKGSESKQAKTRGGRKTTPSPKSQPPKARTLREALQTALSKEIVTKNKNGEEETSTFLDVLASKIVADAVENDGPTRRLLFRQDFMNLELREEEKEAEVLPEEQDIIDIEREYGKKIRDFVSLSPKAREAYSRLLQQEIIDILNDKTRKGE